MFLYCSFFCFCLLLLFVVFVVLFLLFTYVKFFLTPSFPLLLPPTLPPSTPLLDIENNLSPKNKRGGGTSNAFDDLDGIELEEDGLDYTSNPMLTSQSSTGGEWMSKCLKWV